MHHFKDGLRDKTGKAVVPRGLLDEALAAFEQRLRGKKSVGQPMALVRQDAMIDALKVAVEQCAERAEQEKRTDENAQPAFPYTIAPGVCPGMTYRQWLVGQIVAGVYATPDRGYKDEVLDDWRKRIAVSAIRQADAIVAELAQPTPREKP